MTTMIELAIDSPVEDAPTRRPRSEKRQRTEQVKLSLLPAERDALDRAAEQAGFEGNGRLQALIRLRLAGDLTISH